MKNQLFLIILISCIPFSNVGAQVCGGVPPWCTQGNNIIINEYLGGDNTSTVPLRLKTLTPYPVYWWTNNISRMQIYEDQSSGTATNSGFVGIGEFATSGSGAST
jgi:hypothetical protein